MKIESTFTATISLGLKEHYDGITHRIEEVNSICQKYCDEVGLCVTITPTKFIYKNGDEEGCFIGIINYPRFPDNKENITQKALRLAEILLKYFHQLKVSVICDDKTYMLEESDYQ